MRLPTKGLAIALIAALSACGGADLPTPPSGVRVGSILITPSVLTMSEGVTQQVSAIARDETGATISGKALTWSTSNGAVANVTPVHDGGRITAVAPGLATLTAETAGKKATIVVTVSALPQCTTANSIAMNVGEVRTLAGPEKSQLCIGAPIAGAEYKLVLMNNSAPTSLTVQGINTRAVTSNSPADLLPSFFNASESRRAASHFGDDGYAGSDVHVMQREMDALRRHFPANIPRAKQNRMLRSSELPREGDFENFFVNLNDASCTALPRSATARVVKVGKHVILYADVSASSLRYTDAQFASLAATFDTLVYPMDTLNFGAPTDIDGNGRVKVLFTPAVYAAGAFGMVSRRDFLPRSSCPSSNEGEIAYLGSPDPTRTDRAGSQESMFLFSPFLFAHELQHVINVGIRGSSIETVAMNEALSYMAVELLFYEVSGLTPGLNLGSVFPNQAANDAFRWSSELFSFYFFFASRTESNSATTATSSTANYGALWYLLRFAADRRGGNQAATWRSMVNTTAIGVNNIAATFGNVSALLRDWAVSQVVDDVVPNIATNVQFPSWNYRAFGVSPSYPLVESNLSDTPATVSLINGGSAFFQFRVDGGTFARIRTDLDGAVVPTADMMLVRSK